jgi:hypothetical protein
MAFRDILYERTFSFRELMLSLFSRQIYVSEIVIQEIFLYFIKITVDRPESNTMHLMALFITRSAICCKKF